MWCLSFLHWIKHQTYLCHHSCLPHLLHQGRRWAMKSTTTVATTSPTCQTIKSIPKASSSISEIDQNTKRTKVASSKPYTEMSSIGSRLDSMSKASSKEKDDSLRASKFSDITNNPKPSCFFGINANEKESGHHSIVITLSGAILLGMVIVTFFWKRKINNHKPV